MMWSLYEIIHMWTAVIDESEEWSSQLIFNLSNWKEEAWKNQGFNGKNLTITVAQELTHVPSILHH